MAPLVHRFDTTQPRRAHGAPWRHGCGKRHVGNPRGLWNSMLLSGVLMSAIDDLVLLKANLNKLARVPARASSFAARGIKNQIDLDTSSGLDCYGKPFAPLAPATVAKGRNPPPMVDTGRSLDETTVKPLPGAGVAVHVGGHYPRHLQKTANRPARQVVPVRAGLPASWNKRVKDAEKKAIGEAMPELSKGAT